jgi:hypothetical protein
MIALLRSTIALLCVVASFAVEHVGQRGSRGLKDRQDSQRRGLKGGKCSRFGKSSLDGAYAYSNVGGDVGSFGIFTFDGEGGVKAPRGLTVNLPGPPRTIQSQKVNENLSSYSLNRDGRGVVALSFGSPGDPFYDPPLIYDFVVTEADGCKVKHFDSYARQGGLNGQLVTPKWSFISE